MGRIHVTDLLNSCASLVLNVKYIFLIGQLAMILVSNGAGNSRSGSDNVAQAIKCVCNPQECDFIRSEDCPGKGYIVWDPCKCCKVCARTLGEACGGPGGFSGTCEPPLKCVIKPPIIGTGVCTEIPASLSNPDEASGEDCEETISLEAGCDIINRKCECWDKVKVCKKHSIRWDFKNRKECELNLQNVVKNELEFDEDYTLPPPTTTTTTTTTQTINLQHISEYKTGSSNKKRTKLLRTKKKKKKKVYCHSPPCEY